MSSADDDPLAVAIVGLGHMGRKHADCVRESGHQVVAGVDVIESLRQSFGEEYAAQPYDSVDALLEGEDLDAIVDATPNAYHTEAAIRAFRHDVSVLIEKPLAADLEGAERIAAAAEATNGIGMVGFQNRFAAGAELVRAYRDDGFFGDIVHIESNYVRRRGIPTIGSWFTDARLAGGGAVIDIGVHAIDLAMALGGFPEPIEVSAVTRSIYSDKPGYADVEGYSPMGISEEQMGFDVEDSATVFLRCENDRSVSLDISWALDRPPRHDVWIIGSDGGARTDIGGDEVDLFDASSEARDHYVDTHLTGARSRDMHRAQMSYFLACVSDGRPPDISTIEQGLMVQQIIDGIYRSAETKQAARIGDR